MLKASISVADLNVPVLAETDAFLVVDKPVGIPVQGTNDSLLNKLKAQQDRWGELYPVHRLDRVTSGCVIFARTEEANRSLSSAFAERKTFKLYLAISDHKPKKKQGAIIGDMAKSRNGAYKLLRSKENPARTSFFSYSLGGGRRVFVLRLYTGKTHQARVAMKSLGAPILGDDAYGGTPANRVYLHSVSLQVPFDGALLTFQSLPPWFEGKDAQAFLDWFRQHDFGRELPWQK